MESFPKLEERLEHLLSRDYLYEDPASYRAGVIEAAQALGLASPRLELAARSA